MLHSIIIFVVAGNGSPLPWRLRRACDERRVFGCVWGGAAIGGSIARACSREIGHSHSEAAVCLDDIYMRWNVVVYTIPLEIRPMGGGAFKIQRDKQASRRRDDMDRMDRDISREGVWESDKDNHCE